MDFFIMLGFKMIFDLFCFKPKINTYPEPSVEAAFWYGTSYENISKETSYQHHNDSQDIYDKNPSENSEYDQTW